MGYICAASMLCLGFPSLWVVAVRRRPEPTPNRWEHPLSLASPTLFIAAGHGIPIAIYPRIAGGGTAHSAGSSNKLVEPELHPLSPRHFSAASSVLELQERITHNAVRHNAILGCLPRPRLGRR